MKSALAFLLVNAPAVALAQTRWLGSRNERAYRDFAGLADWHWVLMAAAALLLFAYFARRRFWNGAFVWGPTIVAVVLLVLLGVNSLLGFFFKRVDVENSRTPPRRSTTLR